jgi:uncharacterized SAM-binding protein YcdF (DUF218 family)
VKRKHRIAWLALAAVVVLAAVFRVSLLSALGLYLVKTDPLEKADIAVVLAGDGSGHRILKAAELVREGYAPKLLVSGPGGEYGYHECDLAIPFAVKAGYPESMFVHLENDAHSTKEEAQATVAEVRRLGAHRVLLVTSDYHTRRAGKIFRAAAPDLVFEVVAARDEYFHAGDWWRDREGQKTFVIEWLKTVTSWFGI